MNESSEVEATKAKTCIVIDMHENTNKKFGAMSAGIIVASIVIAFIQKSFWPFVIGLTVGFLASYLIRLSCYRRAEQATGLPRSAQDYLLGLYKHDKQFAAAVERARKDTADNPSGEP